MALFALRTMTHDSTDISPVALIHGKSLWMPPTLVYANWLDKYSIDQIVMGYILNLINMLKICQEPAGRMMP